MLNEKAREFIKLNARPIDMARWNYLFENGDRNEVLDKLIVYQNNDGGFGHGLELDCWNIESSPVQTWVATEIIREIGLEDPHNPIIENIIRYLTSGKDFNGHTWGNTVPTNNEYPHAEWWTYNSDNEESYNPTACLAGFLIRFSESDSLAYSLGKRLVRESYEYFKLNFPIESMHTVACYIRLYEYLLESKATNLINMNEFRTLLCKLIKAVITVETDTWETQYVCRPSLFIEKKTDEWYAENKSIADYECEFLKEIQGEDGTWPITWEWGAYPEQWYISKNWWKCDMIIKNLKYIKEMKKDFY